MYYADQNHHFLHLQNEYLHQDLRNFGKVTGVP